MKSEKNFQVVQDFFGQNGDGAMNVRLFSRMW